MEQKNGWVLLVGFLLLLPAFSWAGDYDNLSKSELINIVEQLEKELTPAENKALKLENSLTQALESLKKAENSQKELADTFQTLKKSYEKLSKSLRQGISLGLDAGVLAVPDVAGKLELGLYGGVTLQF